MQVCWVPGSFELPVVAQAMAKSGKFDGVVCIGVVVRHQRGMGIGCWASATTQHSRQRVKRTTCLHGDCPSCPQPCPSSTSRCAFMLPRASTALLAPGAWRDHPLRRGVRGRHQRRAQRRHQHRGARGVWRADVRHDGAGELPRAASTHAHTHRQWLCAGWKGGSPAGWQMPAMRPLAACLMVAGSYCWIAHPTRLHTHPHANTPQTPIIHHTTLCHGMACLACHTCLACHPPAHRRWTALAARWATRAPRRPSPPSKWPTCWARCAQMGWRRRRGARQASDA